MIENIFVCCNDSCAMGVECIRNRRNTTFIDNASWVSHCFIEPEAIDYCRYFLPVDDMDQDYLKHKDIIC